MKRLSLRLGLVLALLVALVGGAVGAQSENVLVVGHAEATDSLDPARGYNQTTGIVHQLIYDGLVTFPADSAADILPDLAESWTISDDGLVYTFSLKQGVLFSNGETLTADDVVFSFNRMINVKSQPSSGAATIASVTAADDSTVVITLNKVDPAILSKLIGPGFQVTEADAVRANGGTDAADAATTDAAEAFLNSTSVGTGPYMLERWEPQVETVLVRNPNYGGDAPYFDRIIISNMPEAATQKIALESGEIDVALDLTADQVATMTDNSAVTVYRGSGNIVHFVLMNANPDIGGPVSNPKVQLAVRYALDYEGYKTLFGGVTPASVIPVGFLGAYGEDRAFKRDLDMARSLLAEAGYPNGFDITLDYPIFTFQGVNMETNAQKIQADLAEVGINVTLRPGELQVSLEGYRNGQQAFGYWFWGPDFIDPQNYIEFMPGMKVGLRAQWSNERADAAGLELRDRALTVTDLEERIAVFAEVQDYMQQNGVFAPFLQPGVQVAYASDLMGYYWHPQWLVDLSLLHRM